MKIYNTLTRRKDEFKPIKEGEVSMYVCGPTVYNFIHIGNARPMIVFDTVRRYFEYKGYKVNYVSNFTDVDDKIIKAANEEGVDSSVISERFINECKKDMAGLNVKPATTHPKATEEIDGMIDMCKTLIDKGLAYEVNGTVYYRVHEFPGYGKLSGKNLEDLRGGNRALLVTGEDEKEDPMDFVLWKPKKEGEPSWPSPWGDGRPGWHIECSCMSKKYIGETIDIHAGGEDLIFPHHENEIAQSEGASGKPFAHYWMHNAFLNIDNRKMSKSLGNFFTVRDISEKYDLQVLRFFMLSAHYRSPLNFSADLMQAAKNGLERIKTCAQALRDYVGEEAGADKAVASVDKAVASADKAVASSGEPKLSSDIDAFRMKFEEAMDDDANTADAISTIFELVKFANTKMAEGCEKEVAVKSLHLLEKLTDVLGIITAAKEDDISAEVEALIAERQQARKEKNFQRADEIRDELLKKGIELKDTREGVKWTRM